MVLSETERKEKELELLELEEAESAENKTPESSDKTNTSNSEDSLGMIGAGAGATLVGAGTYGAARMFNRPARQILSKEKSLDKIKADYLNEPFVASKDVPGRIQLKSNIEQQEMGLRLGSEKTKLQELKLQQGNLSRQLGNDLKNFDDQVLSKTVEEFGLQLKETFRKIVKKIYENYGKKLDEFTLTLEKSNKQLFPQAFAKEVLENTIKDSIAAGVPQEKLGKLLSFRDTFSSSYSNDFNPLTVRHLKGNVDSLSADLPQAAAIKLRDNWGKFLSNNAKEIKSDFHVIQNDYSKFANMRDSIYAEMQGGEFDRTKVNKLLFDFAKSKAETGLTDTVRLMAEGNNVVTGMPEIEAHFKKLQGVVSARKTIQSTGKSLIESTRANAESSLSRINDISRQIKESKLNALKWASKADQLLSEQSQIATKHPIRSGGIGRTIRKIGGVAGRAGTAQLTRGIISMAVPTIQALTAILQAGEFISDPAVGWGKQIGVEVPAKGTLDRFVLEEAINKKPIPPEINVSEEEKFLILQKYGRAL